MRYEIAHYPDRGEREKRVAVSRPHIRRYRSRGEAEDSHCSQRCSPATLPVIKKANIVACSTAHKYGGPLAMYAQYSMPDQKVPNTINGAAIRSVLGESSSKETASSP